MLVDGKTIRDEIRGELKIQFAEHGKVVLAVIWVGDDPATAKFIEQKKRFAESVGVELRLFEYEDDTRQEDLEKEIVRLAEDDEANGIIVQLPLPPHIEARKITDLIPYEKDVDALSDQARVPSPVVQAIVTIIKRYNVSLSNKKIVILGNGKLVGRPTAIWLSQQGLLPTVVTAETPDRSLLIKEADIIISGVGQPGLITKEMLKDGVILIDAGTSEQSGQLAGDAEPNCAEKCSLFTPVPGGVGPVMMAMLFQNLWQLVQLGS